MKIAYSIFTLFLSLIFTYSISAQSKEALQQQFDLQIEEITQLAKSGQLQEAIKKGEIAKTFAFENFKDSNGTQQNILNKLNLYYRFLTNN